MATPTDAKCAACGKDGDGIKNQEVQCLQAREVLGSRLPTSSSPETQDGM